MVDHVRAAYGAWKSPITTDLLVAAAIRLETVAMDGPDCYWLEGRPAEGGRSVLVRGLAGGGSEDLTPPPFNVRTRAHEYGGGAFTVHAGAVWFCNDVDQVIYHTCPAAVGGGWAPPRALTAPGEMRYADLVFDAARNRLIAVREDHGRGGTEPVNELVSIDAANGAVEVLASGHDFYASPTLDPTGKRLAWITWDHPDMPWVASRAWMAELDSRGRPGDPVEVAGGSGESVFQPTFSPDGVLYVVCDRGGWWNLHRWDGDAVRPVAPAAAEFGRPQWQFGMRTYGFASAGRIVACRCEHGQWSLTAIDVATGAMERIPCGLTSIGAIAVQGDRCLLLGGAAMATSRVIEVNALTGDSSVWRVSADPGLDERMFAAPEAISFHTGDDETAHAFLYRPNGVSAPTGAAYWGEVNERPPLLVVGHGGPTASTSATLDLRLQYWTSRGFAVLDVNYRGSTGYGRAYRNRLEGEWGVADVEDCVAGARYLGREGIADPARLAIRGGSAGGYTALAALCFHEVFAAGASYYGISDLEILARDTHKFESRYLDWLIGAYPDRRDLYVARSPINHVDRLSCPVIFFQGKEDKVVPPNQAQAMVAALDAKGLPVAYLEFEGEQHGFRKAETIRATLEAELVFYGRIFGFAPTGNLAPVPVRNLAPD